MLLLRRPQSLLTPLGSHRLVFEDLLVAARRSYRYIYEDVPPPRAAYRLLFRTEQVLEFDVTDIHLSKNYLRTQPRK